MTGQPEPGYDIPACWVWAPPPADLVEREGLTSWLLSEWQDGRCAACGLRPEQLVEDHDHYTGLIRGYLCRSCNVIEGKGRTPMLTLYRTRNPATILGIEEVYVNIYGQTPMRPRDWTPGEFEEVAARVESALAPRSEGEEPSRPSAPSTVRRVVHPPKEPTPRCGRPTQTRSACRAFAAAHSDVCGHHMTDEEREYVVLAAAVERVFGE